jgi:beta-lactam-binding protein with PASTA domain
VTSSGADDALAPINGQPVPDVVGMTPEDACHALLRSGYSGGVFDEAPGTRPGRVVRQVPEHGYVGGEGQLVHLTVSEPFRNALPEGSACVERRAERLTERLKDG